MDINITVTHALSPTLQALLSTIIASATLATETPTPVSDAPSPKRTRKAAVEPTPEAPVIPMQPAAAPKATAAPSVAATAAVAQLTREDVANVVTGAMGRIGTEPLKKLFTEKFKIARLVELDPARYPELVAEITALTSLV